jgi:hypothetical protein
VTAGGIDLRENTEIPSLIIWSANPTLSVPVRQSFYTAKTLN